MIGHLIYTYDRIDDARIQQEISSTQYSGYFGDVHIVHAYNGEMSPGKVSYLEDKLLTMPNRGHYQGAVDLINAGLAYFSANGPGDIRYVVVTAADTWALDGEFLANTVAEMEANVQVLATSSWMSRPSEPPKGFALDFFVIDLEWNRTAALFPLDYEKFFREHSDAMALLYLPPYVEYALQYRYHKHFLDTEKDNGVFIRRNQSLRRIVEREPACMRDNKLALAATGIYHSHLVNEKQAVLRGMGMDFGEHSRKLKNAESLGYYNAAGG